MCLYILSLISFVSPGARLPFGCEMILSSHLNLPFFPFILQSFSVDLQSFKFVILLVVGESEWGNMHIPM